jgi:2,5-furandicarboxylate decarboxylase 1
MHITNPLLEGKLMLSRTRYSQLYVPSHTEIVFEGRILNDKTHEEWMVEMLRTHDFKRKQPVFELERIMLRNDAIYHDILPSYAKHRLLMGMPIEAKMYDNTKKCGAYHPSPTPYRGWQQLAICGNSDKETFRGRT